MHSVHGEAVREDLSASEVWKMASCLSLMNQLVSCMPITLASLNCKRYIGQSLRSRNPMVVTQACQGKSPLQSSCQAVCDCYEFMHVMAWLYPGKRPSSELFTAPFHQVPFKMQKARSCGLADLILTSHDRRQQQGTRDIPHPVSCLLIPNLRNISGRYQARILKAEIDLHS